MLMTSPSCTKVKWIKSKQFSTQGSGLEDESTRIFSVFKISHNLSQQIANNKLKGHPKFVFFTKVNAEMLEKVYSFILLVEK